MKRAAIVYNPVAGPRTAAQRAERACEMLRADGWTVELHATAGPHDAEPFARSRSHDIDLLVVAAGDGSIRSRVRELLADAKDADKTVLTQALDLLGDD